ncbi:MAG: hypothetical protein R3A13_02885 [Bdellovibrionota bacterium]
MLSSITHDSGEHSLQNYKIVVAGGDSSSQQAVRNIVQRLNKFANTEGLNVEVILGDLMCSGNSSLCIDIDDGSFHNFVADPNTNHDFGLNITFGKNIARRIR